MSGEVTGSLKRLVACVVGAGLGLGLVALPTLGQKTSSSAGKETPGAAPTRPNLVLITLDTTRADHLGAWGWPHARTPHLDALAARGTRFARCDTAVPVTLPSHSTLLTGLYPPRHGVRDNGTFVLPAEVETLAERLAKRDYDTAAVVSAVVLARHYGLDQGFRRYDDDMGTGYAASPEAAERPAGATTDAALDALGALARPYFLWVHYYDPHDAYNPPEPFASQAQGPHALYDGEIATMDAEIGRLLAALPADTAVVVVGDHGEMLGEKGEATHGLLLARGARRVPLVLAGPGAPAGRTVDCLVRTVDVAPTLLALAGVEPPGGLDGESLLPLLEDEPACTRVSYSESFLPFFAYRWYPLRALSDGRWLYVHGPRPSLYDLSRDAGEDNDLAATQPERAEGFKADLSALLAGMGEELEGPVAPASPMSAEDRRRLESLGYLGGGGGQGEVRADLPDPREMTGVARGVQEASDLVRAGRPEVALPKLLELLRRDPENVPALNLAGLALMAAGRLQSALNAFERAAAVNPDSGVAVTNAGHCLLRMGRPDEAAERYRLALELDPTSPGAASNLAGLLREGGKGGEAAKVLERALAAGSHHPGLYLERGMLAAGAGDLPAAYDDFREAARRDPANPVPLANAARAAALLERFAEAAQLYEALLRLAPERADLWTALGGLYAGPLGDPAAARRCLERALELEPDPQRKARLRQALAGLG